MSISIIPEEKDEVLRDVHIGIIGCGGIANGKHLPSLSKLPNVKITAFCDLIPERAEKAKKEFGTDDAVVYTDYQLLLKQEDLEVIHVLTPNVSHCELAVAALESGHHVMCEKPMATTYVEAQRMVEASKKAGKFLTVGYQTRSQTSHQYVRKMIERGDLGEIYYIKAPSIRKRGVPLWGVFLDKEQQGGGPMIDIGTHSIDAALSLIQNYDVASVTGSVYRKLADTAYLSNEWGIWDPEKLDFSVEDSAMSYVRFKNGATLVIEAAWLLNYAGDSHMTLCGTKGGVEFLDGGVVRFCGDEDGSFYTKDVKPNNTARTLFKGQNLTGEEYEAKQWIYSVIHNIPPVTKPEEAAVVTQIIEATYRSAQEGKTIYF
ncbi:Gfo/Idh/MocA family protein [Scatolibacter rhodanostii]|uniref:Gfo/Idh/MocA family protein n=1 Tax=Scatolibacter rhodanostii TaxID=2014781 RepID=UPI000C06A232|nr:Gfo/Idh/MocA family oxidoreductase [Scatolibacter rhodanostii]